MRCPHNAQANYYPDGATLAHPEWERLCSIYIERDGATTKKVDHSPPSDLQIQALQVAFDHEYPGDQVDLASTLSTAQWEWVDGFRLRDKRLGISFKVGDDVKIASTMRRRTFARIDSCLVGVVNSKVYYFTFPKWYDVIGKVPVFGEEEKKFATEAKLTYVSPMETIVRKWDPIDGGQNIPIPIHRVTGAVMLLHRCVRTCVVDPSHEDCTCHSRCRTKLHCSNHPNSICSSEPCKRAGAIEWSDLHNPLLLDYTVYDEDAGFQAVL
jgi:hypothetical protein